MVLQSASIVFNDSASQFNKDLTDFLKRSLETAIRKGNLAFQFKIAKPADLANLRSMGVKKLPAMIIGKKTFVGVPEIIGEIRNRVKNSRVEAAVKSDDEIVRDYQMKALGNITKDADGKFQVNDEPEKEEDDLMSAFNKEVQRRGATAGHGNEEMEAQGKRQRQQQAPRRDTEHEMEDEDDKPQRRRPPQQANRPRNGGPPAAPRADNIDNPAMADAYESLNRISRNATGEDAQDDAMMGALLARLGGD